LPGHVPNPAGKPLGSRRKIAEAIVRDFSDAWQKHGNTVLDNMALSEPAKFAQLAAGLIPKEFALTIGSRLPGNLESAWRLRFILLRGASDARGSSHRSGTGFSILAAVYSKFRLDHRFLRRSE